MGILSSVKNIFSGMVPKKPTTPPLPTLQPTNYTPMIKKPADPMGVLSTIPGAGNTGAVSKTSTMPIGPAKPVLPTPTPSPALKPMGTATVGPATTSYTPPPLPNMAANYTTPSGVTVNPNTGGVAQPQTPAPAPAPATPPTTPTLPTVNTASAPAADPNETAISEAEKAYQANLNMTPEEEKAQKELDALQQSYKTSYLNAQDQPIALEFITGQQKSAEERALNLAEPLQAQLARLQAKRVSALNASKFALDRADKAAASAKGDEKPLTIGDNLVKYNKDTGQYEAVYSAPKDAKNPEGFTLSQGQARYDAEGNLIASVDKAPDDITPYQAEQLNIARERLAQSQGQQKALSAEAAKLVNNSKSALDDIKYLRTQVASNIGSGKFLNPQYKAAENNIVDVIGRLRSGGAIQKDEADRFMELLPGVMETDTTRKSKLDRLEKLLTGVIEDVQTRGGNSAQVAMDGPGDALDEALNAAGFKKDPGKSLKGLATGIAYVESGGRYTAIGPVTAKGQRAYGKYQVMDFNIPNWTKAALGRALTPQEFLNNPEAQEKTVMHKLNQLMTIHGNPADVASVWFSGRPIKKAGMAKDVTGTSVPQYVKKVLQHMS